MRKAGVLLVSALGLVAVTADARGAGPPPGTFHYSIEHETLGEMTQNVTVATGEPAEISFSFGSS